MRHRIVCALFGGLLGSAFLGSTDGADPEPSERTTAALMKRKLADSQAVLEGLLKDDMGRIRGAAKSLHDIARTPLGDRADDAVYRHFNVEFQRLTEKLQLAAEKGNVDAATYVHNQLTSTCISCHQHVRNVKRLPIPVRER